MLDALAVDLEADDGARSLDESFGPEVFPLTDDATLEMPRRRGRRLVLVMPGESPHPTQTWNCWRMVRHWEASTTLSVAVQDRGPEVSEDETFAFASVPDPPVMVTRGWTPAVRAALCGRFGCSVIRRAVVMKTVPKFLRGPHRSAMRLAMEEALHENDHRRERGWKLFFLLPRLLLFRPARGGNTHKGKLAQRFQYFSEGRWSELLRVSTQSAEGASKAQSRKRRHRIVEQELDRRASRALSLVQMGELSSGRQALEGASLAPGTRQTLEALRDPIRRPPVPRDPLPHTVVGHMPDVRFSLEEHRFAANLRSSRRGAAAGLSGMTTDHLRPLSDHIEETH